jgi:oxalate decarboxylase/phosphoglucose isomerase-like protein (cupin superfamily)
MSRLDDIEVLTGRRREDARGWLHVVLGASQLPTSASFGELYVVQSTREDDRRGDHLHRRMDEWFSVVSGAATLELRDPDSGASRTIALDAGQPTTVRVPAGVAHCLVQRGSAPMIAVAWATAEYDPDDVVPSRTS